MLEGECTKVGSWIHSPDNAVVVVQVTFVFEEFNPSSSCNSKQHWYWIELPFILCADYTGACWCWRQSAPSVIMFNFWEREHHPSEGIVNLWEEAICMTLRVLLWPPQNLYYPHTLEHPQSLWGYVTYRALVFLQSR